MATAKGSFLPLGVQSPRCSASLDLCHVSIMRKLTLMCLQLWLLYKTSDDMSIYLHTGTCLRVCLIHTDDSIHRVESSHVL